MLFYAKETGNQYAILDLTSSDFRELDFNLTNARIINTYIKKAVLNGLSPMDTDDIIGLAVAKNITANMDANISSLFWNNIDVWETMAKKELKNLVYWLNEYLDINDIQTVINSIAKYLIIKLKGLELKEIFNDDENNENITTLINVISNKL